MTIFVRRKARFGDVIVAIDFGATTIGVTIFDLDGNVLLKVSIEVPSRASEGPQVSVEQMYLAATQAITAAGKTWDDVLCIGLDTPGPADGKGTIGAAGSVNLKHAGWANFGIAEALQNRCGRPVYYLNDGVAAAIWAYHCLYKNDLSHILVMAAIGTGLGGGDIIHGIPHLGFDGRASEHGHEYVDPTDILEPGQPVPVCNCGRRSDVEAWASLTAISKSLLSWHLQKDAKHPLHQVTDLTVRAHKVRDLAVQGDSLCRAIFAQQAKAIAGLFENLAMVHDFDTAVIGGGVADTPAEFQAWFLKIVTDTLMPRLWPAQRPYIKVLFQTDGDEAGMRGAGLYALQCAKKEGLIAA